MYGYDGSIDWNMYLAITTVIFVWVCSEYQIITMNIQQRKIKYPAVVELVCSTEDALLVCS